jgi:hypothetical protein
MVRIIKIIITCSFLPGLFFPGLYAQIPTEKLIGHYPFNGNTDDESGNGFHGSASGAKLSADRFGLDSTAYSFNGTGDYILLSNNFDLLPRTISLWFNTTNMNYIENYGSIYQSDNPSLSNGNVGMAIKDINGRKTVIMTISGVTDTAIISAYNWYHVVLVSDSLNSVSFYLDGKLISKKKFKNNLRSINGVNNTVVGSDRHASGNYFQGLIDDIRIYNMALSKSEINALFTENSFSKGNYQPISVYPNPSSGNINIDFGSVFSSNHHHSFRITNSIGQILYSDQIKQKLINLDLSSKFSKGLYIIYILDSDNQISDVQKLVIQ